MQVLVLETCNGLVTGAVAERLGGFGHVCTTHLGDKCPPLEATRLLNFPDRVKQSMSTAPLATLLEYQEQPVAEEAQAHLDPAGQPGSQAEGQSEGQPDGQAKGQPDGQPGSQAEGQSDGHKLRQQGQQEEQQEAGNPISSSMQNQQVAGMNGSCMRDLLVANSKQLQTAVVAALGSTLQAQTGTALVNVVTLHLLQLCPVSLLLCMSVRSKGMMGSR